ncbi:MAG: hypothetical protein FJ246_05115 [Nitrospira sp.]|nr:hypothetical protein [Nitrospira sp.]
MKRIPIEQLTPGMTLAKPVTGPTGQMVLAAGATLEASLIARLRDLGLALVAVETPGEQEAPSQTLTELEQALDRRFQHVSENPELLRIRESIRQHLRATHGANAKTAEGAPSCRP